MSFDISGYLRHIVLTVLFVLAMLVGAVVVLSAGWYHDNEQKHRWHDAYEQTHARFEHHMGAMNEEGCHVRKFVPLPKIPD